MRILVVDDDPNKIRQLMQLIRSEFPDAEAEEQRSYQSGLKAALLNTPDVMLLDMTMPTFDVGGKEKGGRERRYAGRQVLHQLQRKRVETKVVVVTQFERFGEGPELITLDELRAELKREFPVNYVTTVFYQAADSQWMDSLREVLKSLVGPNMETDNG